MLGNCVHARIQTLIAFNITNISDQHTAADALSTHNHTHSTIPEIESSQWIPNHLKIWELNLYIFAEKTHIGQYLCKPKRRIYLNKSKGIDFRPLYRCGESEISILEVCLFRLVFVVSTRLSYIFSNPALINLSSCIAKFSVRILLFNLFSCWAENYSSSNRMKFYCYYYYVGCRWKIFKIRSILYFFFGMCISQKIWIFFSFLFLRRVEGETKENLTSIQATDTTALKWPWFRNPRAAHFDFFSSFISQVAWVVICVTGRIFEEEKKAREITKK